MHSIRKMQSYDIKKAGEIWLTTSIEAHDFVPEQFWRSDLATMTPEILPHPRTEAYAYEAESRIERFIPVNGTHVGCLFVRTERQCQGIGAALLRFVKQTRSKLNLSFYKQNVRATSFYRREGFRISGESTCQHTGCDEYNMTWTLAAEPTRAEDPCHGTMSAPCKCQALSTSTTSTSHWSRASSARSFRNGRK